MKTKLGLLDDFLYHDVLLNFKLHTLLPNHETIIIMAVYRNIQILCINHKKSKDGKTFIFE